MHVPLVGDQRAARAAIYPKKLCQAICRGLMKAKQRLKMGLCALMVVEEATNEKRKVEEQHEDTQEEDAWDDVSGVRLDPRW